MKAGLWLGIAAVIVAVAIGANFANVGVPADDSRVPPAANDAAKTRAVFAAGVIEGAQREVSLQFELAGRITAIPVTEGQIVVQGDLCAQLDDTLWQHELREAAAAQELAQAELQRLLNGERAESRAVVRAEGALADVRVQQAIAKHERAERLFEKNALDSQERDQYRFDYELALAQAEQVRARIAEIEAGARVDDVRMANAKVELAAAAVAQAHTMLERTMLRAPLDGVILLIDMEPGELVAGAPSPVVVTITSLSQMRVRAYVEELDALALRPGDPAYVIADGRPDVRYSGQVTWMAPVMGPKSRQHHHPGEKYDVEVREVLILLDNGDDLVVGLPVDVFMSASDKAQADVVAPRVSEGTHEPAT